MEFWHCYKNTDSQKYHIPSDDINEITLNWLDILSVKKTNINNCIFQTEQSQQVVKPKD